MNLDEVSQLIHNRRSIFPKVFTGEHIADDIVMQILNNANQAPSHKHTEPWRFHVFTGAHKKKLGEYFQGVYKEHMTGSGFKELKYNKLAFKVEKSSHVIAICMQRDMDESLPEWEEIAAVSCAVQNIYLSVTAAGLGGYWSSPTLMMDHISSFINMQEGERCLGFFYLGVPKEGLKLSVQKKAVESKMKWYR